MGTSFLNKKCLILGGNSGIGLELVKLFYQEGADIIIASHFVSSSINDLTTKFENSSSIHFFKIDITKNEDHNDLYEFIKEKFTSLDILIVSTGLGLYKEFEAISLEEIDQVISTNLIGSIKIIRTILPVIKNASGHPQIIQIGSYAGKEKGHEYFSIYSAAKSGLLGFFHSLSQEYHQTNIRFYLFYLPGVQTSFFSKSIGGDQFENKISSSTLMPANIAAQKIIQSLLSVTPKDDYIVYL